MVNMIDFIPAGGRKEKENASLYSHTGISKTGLAVSLEM